MVGSPPSTCPLIIIRRAAQNTRPLARPPRAGRRNAAVRRRRAGHHDTVTHCSGTGARAPPLAEDCGAMSTTTSPSPPSTTSYATFAATASATSTQDAGAGPTAASNPHRRPWLTVLICSSLHPPRLPPAYLACCASGGHRAARLLRARRPPLPHRRHSRQARRRAARAPGRERPGEAPPARLPWGSSQSTRSNQKSVYLAAHHAR
jgi:hypothetical protein